MSTIHTFITQDLSFKKDKENICKQIELVLAKAEVYYSKEDKIGLFYYGSFKTLGGSSGSEVIDELYCICDFSCMSNEEKCSVFINQNETHI